MGIEEIIKKVPTEPKGVDKWIREYCALGTYLIYDKKVGKVVCTRCGKEYPAEDYMRHDECTESDCGHTALYKAAGLGRKKLAEYFRTLIFTRRRNKVYATLSEVVLDFTPFGQPEIRKQVVGIYTFDKKGIHYYKYDWWSEKYVEIKNVKVPHVPRGNWYSEPKFEMVFIYRDNLEDVFLKSDLKYLWNKELIDLMNAFQIVQYAKLGMTYQSIELLYKAGFHQIVIDKINEYGPSGAVYWRGKTLQKILRLNMGDIRRVREHNPTLDSLRVYQTMTDKERRTLPWESVVATGQAGSYMLNKLAKYAHYASAVKVVDYVEKERQKHKQQYVRIGDWIDYIEAAEKIGLNMNKKDVIFPRDLKEAHDTAIGALKENENKETSEKIKKRALGITFEKDGLMIIEADSVKCLYEESAQLNHCVKTYADKVAGGKCKIFFIRKTEQPEKSFYTLEADPKGKFVQCRGDHNCGMTPEIESFKDEFLKYLKKELNKKARKAA